MLSKKKIRRTQELLLRGRLSHRKIAERLNISRSAVQQVALGRRMELSARETQSLDPLDESWYSNAGPKDRCPGCGGMVHLPCRLCGVRTQEEVERELRRTARSNAAQIALRLFLTALRRRQLQHEDAERLRPRKAS